MRFVLMPANRYDTVGVAPLIRDVQFGAMLADKAFDSNWIIEDMNARGAKIVISQRHDLPLLSSHQLKMNVHRP